MNKKQWLNIGKIILGALMASLVLTLVYIKLPPFYIYSFNFSVVPKLEVIPGEFSYNAFYQSQVSQTIVSSLSLFAASSDFKKTIENDLNSSVLYLMSKTNGISIISLRLVTFKKLDEDKTSLVLKNRLQETLSNFVPKDLIYSINTLDSFNHNYTAVISYLKFFTLCFGTLLMGFSLFYMLRVYYYKD